MISIIKHPLFIFGILLKLFFILANYQFDVFYAYLNFIEHGMTHPTNAWSAWNVNSDLDSFAFPYGIVMLFIFLPYFTLQIF